LLQECYKAKKFLKLDILEKKVITFDWLQSRGAYDRGSLNISILEFSWTIPGAFTRGIRTTDIPSQNDDDLYTCVEAGRQGRQEPCGRVAKGRLGVLYRNHNFAGQGCYRETIYSLLVGKRERTWITCLLQFRGTCSIPRP
jgi:hypothetical protein